MTIPTPSMMVGRGQSEAGAMNRPPQECAPTGLRRPPESPRKAEGANCTWGDYAERCAALKALAYARRDYRRWMYWAACAELFVDWPVDHLCEPMEISGGAGGFTLASLWAELERDERILNESREMECRCQPNTRL